MFVRSEDDILNKAPIQVRLGATDQPIKPLGISAGMEWRKQLADQLGDVMDNFAKPATPGNLGTALATALLKFPEKLANLVFAYAPNLDRDAVMEEATDEQLVRAFSGVMQLAFPHLGQLEALTMVLKSRIQSQ